MSKPRHGKLARKWRRRQFGRNLRKAYSPKSGITWVFHTAPGEPCQACTINTHGYDYQGETVIHRRLSEVLAETEAMRYLRMAYGDPEDK